MAINGHTINEIVEFWIPQDLISNNIPETDIYVPSDAIGLSAYFESCSSSKDDYIVIEFYDSNNFLDSDIFKGTLDEFLKIANDYLVFNDQGPYK